MPQPRLISKKQVAVFHQANDVFLWSSKVSPPLKSRQQKFCWWKTCENPTVPGRPCVVFLSRSKLAVCWVSSGQTERERPPQSGSLPQFWSQTPGVSL